MISELSAARRAGSSLLLIAFLFSIFVNLLMLTGPLFMLQVYDRVLSSRSEETLAALFILVGFLYALMAGLDYARGRLVARYGAAFQAKLDGPVFDACFQRRSTQNANTLPELQRLDAIQSLLASPVFLAMFDLPWSPLFLLAIFVFHPMLGWVALAGGGVLVVVALLNQLLTTRKVGQAQGAGQVAQKFAGSANAAHEIIETQGMRDAVRQRWLTRQDKALELRVSSADWTGSFTSFSKAFRLFLQSAMLGVGAYYVLRGELTAGAMIAASILLGRALAPIEQSLGQWAAFQRANLAWKSLKQLLGSTPEIASKTALPVPDAKLTSKGVIVVPPGERSPTLKGITLSVSPGEALGVIGKSGSGKSTLAKALLGLWEPANGEIRLGGAKLDQYSTSDLGRHIGYLPQDVTLLEGTIAENIARMSTEVNDADVVAASKRANAHEMILSLPDGYDTELSGDQDRLSGGQKQRIALARALYGDPVLLVLDEPNSALDNDGSEALNQTIREFKAASKAVIVMTHRPTAIAECDKIAILDQGQVVDFGPRDEILQKRLKNANMVQRQLTGTKPA